MSKFVKNNLIKLVLIGLLIIWMGLNCLGFCFDKMRFISDDEKIKLSVTRILKEYPKLVDGKWKIRPGKGDDSNDWEAKSLPSSPIPYREIDEFFALNPNCCYVTRHYQSIFNSDGGDDVTFGDCMSGRKTSVVVVHYLLRYRDEKGKLQTETLEDYSSMNNCGKFVWDY